MMKPYPAINFSWKCCLLFTSAEYIQVHFRLLYILSMEANFMNPDQTATPIFFVPKMSTFYICCIYI